MTTLTPSGWRIWSDRGWMHFTRPDGFTQAVTDHEPKRSHAETLRMLLEALAAQAPAQQAAQPVATDKDSLTVAQPVAWRYTPSDAWRDCVLTDDPAKAALAREHGREVQPLYTAAPAPVGLLTDRQLYTMARAAGVLIVTQREEDAAVEYGRAVLAAVGIKAGKDTAS